MPRRISRGRRGLAAEGEEEEAPPPRLGKLGTRSRENSTPTGSKVARSRGAGSSRISRENSRWQRFRSQARAAPRTREFPSSRADAIQSGLDEPCSGGRPSGLLSTTREQRKRKDV